MLNASVVGVFLSSQERGRGEGDKGFQNDVSQTEMDKKNHNQKNDRKSEKQQLARQCLI
jgi:hypothetical protein